MESQLCPAVGHGARKAGHAFGRGGVHELASHLRWVVSVRLQQPDVAGIRETNATHEFSHTLVAQLGGRRQPALVDRLVGGAVGGEQQAIRLLNQKASRVRYVSLRSRALLAAQEPVGFFVQLIQQAVALAKSL